MSTQEQVSALANGLRPALPTEDVCIAFIVHAAEREFADSPVDIQDIVLTTVRALLESGEIIDAGMTPKGYVPRGIPLPPSNRFVRYGMSEGSHQRSPT